MAKDVITRFRLESSGFDSAIKKASKELSEYSKTATQAKEGFNQFTKSNVEAARALGTMETTSTNAKDKVKELVGAYNEAAKAYNNLSREHQQSDWAKALSGSLTQLQERIRETKAEMQGLTSSTSSSGSIFSGMGDKMGGMLQVFGGNLMTKAFDFAVGNVVNLGSEISSCIKEGVELAKQGEGIRIAFERLGRGDILQGLREATHGTVTDIELMKAAVKFNDFKLPVEELGTMLAFAQQKAKDTGQSIDYMVDSIVTGLGRKSLMILDNLGLSATEVKEKMAETGDMTKAVGAIIREQMSKAGDYVETAADRATQADVELKNAMEELGRTFQPLTDAGTSMWKSLKIGALELLNDAVKPLIENLTYAGRLKAQLDKMNGGGNGRPSEVQKQLGFLQNTSAGNRQKRYEKQLGIYAQAEEQEWRRVNAQRNQLNAAKAAIAKTTPSGTLADASESQKEYLKGLEQSLNISIAKAKEWGNITKQYKEGAKAILNPVKETVDDTIKGVDELKKKLIDLQAERKKVAAGTDEAKRLDAEIRQVKADIKLQDPNAFKTTTTHTLTKPEQAEQKFDQAQKDYNQALEQAAMEVKAGTITSAEGKKKELQATETLWKAIGDAREIYDSPKLQEEQKKVEAAYTELAGETSAAIEAQKAAEKAARELEQAQKRLADAQNELADAQASGDLKKIYAAEKKVETAQVQVDARRDALQKLQDQTIKVNVEQGTVDLPSVPTDDQTIKVNVEQGEVNLPSVPEQYDIPITISNLDAVQQNLKEKIGETDLGDSLMPKLEEGLSDATAIGAIFKTAIKNGIDTTEFDTSGLMQKILNGEDISDETIQGFVQTLNEKLVEAFGEDGAAKLKVVFDVDDKQIKNLSKTTTEEAQNTQKAWSLASQSVNNMGSALNAIDDPAAKAAGTVIKAIADIALGFAQASHAADATASGWGWLAWLAAGTAAMATTISTVHSLTGFADGGIVPGNSYSGDNLHTADYGINSGELILNRAQQGVIADALENEGGGAISSNPYVTGEMIYLGLNNYLKGAGLGQIVTSNG